MAQFKVIGAFLLSILLSATAQHIVSPPVTDWGDWGYFDNCPNGTAARGFQLKTEPFKGPLVDDTALNAIRFFCGNPLDPNTRIITSALGSWGIWGNTYACGQDGFIVGFQLRVERPGLVQDETATNNARFICSNMEDPNNYIEGDGLNFGSWGRCRDAIKGMPFAGSKLRFSQIEGQFLMTLP